METSKLSKIYDVVRDAGLDNRVKLLRQKDDVRMILAVTDIFALPYHREGVPRSVIEAQAIGVA